eukprot:14538500-Alexandrium_andersonii.AAC.1
MDPESVLISDSKGLSTASPRSCRRATRGVRRKCRRSRISWLCIVVACGGCPTTATWRTR